MDVGISLQFVFKELLVVSATKELHFLAKTGDVEDKNRKLYIHLVIAWTISSLK